jgi:hypothetical protein
VVSLPPEDGLKDSEEVGTSWTGRTVLGVASNASTPASPEAIGDDGPASDADACQVVPSSRWAAMLRSADSTHSALELPAVVVRGLRTTYAAFGAAGGRPVA